MLLVVTIAMYLIAELFGTTVFSMRLLQYSITDCFTKPLFRIPGSFECPIFTIAFYSYEYLVDENFIRICVVRDV